MSTATPARFVSGTSIIEAQRARIASLEAEVRRLTLPADPHTPEFSKGERRIIGFLLMGMANKEIAAYCSTTTQCIKNALRYVYRDTGVATRLELMVYLYERPRLKAVLLAEAEKQTTCH